MSRLLRSWLRDILSPVLSKVTQYRGRYKGETCYLIGGGISLKWFHLPIFSDKIALPCNFLPFHKDFDSLNVENCLLIEPWWFYPVQRTTSPPVRLIRNSIQKSYRGEINNNKHINFFVNVSCLPVLYGLSNISYIFNVLVDENLPADHLINNSHSFSGSFTASVTLAAYMGFEQCTLLGFDYTHLPSRSMHWFERGTGVLTPHHGYMKDFIGHAKEFIDISTITLDGDSEYLDSVTYLDYTGRLPEYKENDEIVEKRYLDVLSTWPGYKIF